MLGNPGRPLVAGLDSDGVVRLRYGSHPPDLRTSAHVPGHLLLPGGLPIEQDVVWVFPSLAAAPVTPYAVRDLARQSWAFSVGAVFHRAFRRHVNHNEQPIPWTDGLRRAAQAAVDELYTVHATDLPTVDVVAGLETPVDLFGAPSEALLNAVAWAFGAEHALADAYRDTYRQTSTDIVRYRSRESLFAQEWSLMQHRLPELTRHYVASAYDILQLWTGDGSSWADVRRARARSLGDELFGLFRAH
ncbi:hypothetical protein [Gordonia phthalatica]|uniref:Uncharacterized protein n=1 Tax=Gordonia phthalatica TaxID=1136941 RepID=A0A0N7FUT6_9ACTN|nr:hypothetical protein [Gordonia phthalatica]ALG85263.1 hypothetical protein ACH46_13230 [Gordonia phthalatica]